MAGQRTPYRGFRPVPLTPEEHAAAAEQARVCTADGITNIFTECPVGEACACRWHVCQSLAELAMTLPTEKA